MAQIKISALTTGIPQGTDQTPAVDIFDLTQSSTGTTKKYIRSDELNYYLSAQGLVTYAAVLVATTTNLSAVYNNGTSGVGATLTNSGSQAALIIDGVSLIPGNRVLVKNQASNFENGIYVVSNSGTATTNWVLTRAIDFDEASEIIQYGVVLSNTGLSNAGILWQETNSGPWVIGSTAIIFAEYIARNVNAGLVNELAYYAAPGSIISGLATVNNAALTTNSSGTPTWQALLDGELLIGSSSGSPIAGNLNAGPGITISNGANSITIATNGAGVGWNEDLTGNILAVANTGYICKAAGQTLITLPNICLFGDTIEIEGFGIGGWQVIAGGSQTIQIGRQETSVGGTITSDYYTDNIELVCVDSNNTWRMQRTNSNGLSIT